MLVLVSYDVSTTSAAGKRRLHSVAKACEGSGNRVQNSVFECDVDPAQWERLKTRLLGIVELTEDSLRFYFLGSNWKSRIEHHGVQKGPDPDELLLI
jgi:CRISPR-associated protein Cas2